MTPALAAVVMIFCITKLDGTPVAWQEDPMDRQCTTINAEVPASTIEECSSETDKLTASFLEKHRSARLVGQFCTLQGDR